MKKIKHFLSINDLSSKEIWQILLMAKKLKAELKTKGENSPLLKNKSQIMLFEKPSLRTKLSFDLAMNQLGGHSVYFGQNEVGIGTRESVSDIAKVSSSMADLIIARVYSHKALEEFAESSTVPVINALSDLEHPCQALADLLTIFETKGKLEGLTVSFIGDADNNVARSLKLGCELLGMNFQAGSPDALSAEEAAEGADVIVTDTWISMGQEDEAYQRLKKFSPYQVNQKLMKLAKKDAIFLHCLPSHRGYEVTSEVIDGPQSKVFQEAENRLHVQKSLLIHLSI